MKALRTQLLPVLFFSLGNLFLLAGHKAYGLSITLPASEFEDKPVLIVLRDWNGLQFWQNDLKVCIPYLFLAGKDDLGIWVRPHSNQKNPDDSKVSTLKPAVELNISDLSCDNWQDKMTELEIFHLGSSKLESILRQSEFSSEIVWRPQGIQNQMYVFPEKEIFQVHLRTHEYAAKSARIEIPVVQASSWSPVFRLNSSMTEIREALILASRHIQKNQSAWVLRLKSPSGQNKSFRHSVWNLLKNLVTIRDPTLTYETQGLQPGEFQFVLTQGEVPDRVIDRPTVFKPKELDPAEISANTREKWQKIENLRWKKRPGWFAEIPFFVEHERVSWIEGQLLVIPLKASQAVTILEMKGEDTDPQVQVQIYHSGLTAGRQKGPTVKPVVLKKGPNRWKFYQIILK